MENNKKWYNIDLLEKESLKEFLQSKGYQFEISGNGKYYHFEILLDSAGFCSLHRFFSSDI